MAFSTGAANDAFKAAFTLPVSGDSIISALPASLVKKLYDAFSLEMKIEEAAKGKKGEKKD